MKCGQWTHLDAMLGNLSSNNLIAVPNAATKLGKHTKKKAKMKFMVECKHVHPNNR
jgi:hypothetical protein